MSMQNKYLLCAIIIYAIGIIGLLILKFYAGFFILVPGMAYTIYKLIGKV